MRFGGLRTKLVASFAGVVLLCLALAGSAFVYLLQPYQSQQALNRLAELALPLAVQVRILEIQGATPSDIASFLEDQARDLDVRILLIGQENHQVFYDTEDVLVGNVLSFDPPSRPALFPVLRGVVDVPGEGRLAIVTIGPGPAGDRLRRRAGPEAPRFTIALAAPQASLAVGWRQIAPQLGTAALISLVASIAVAFVIARSISRPLAAITRASEAMAQGDYNQQIDVRGHDEIARLASAFNLMAQQVSTSNRTLREFLADVSHELRTPLTTIEGFSQAILDRTASDPTAIDECARIISEDADRMHRMVEDLLYLSRIESGQLPMDLERGDLMTMVEASVRRARQRADGVALHLESTADPMWVTVDSHRIEQVLDNLLSNAVKHTASGSAITVSTAKNGREARVRVHNHGSYVEPQDRGRIFERFWRGVENNGSGTGLGLSIASEIARMHSGRIEIESSRSDGTAFTLVLPENAS
ncbi:MAG: putative Histidine kinase [Chloroflexi bacterium]|nr:putative Histidine kinase [Chloroflexota bacterium]